MLVENIEILMVIEFKEFENIINYRYEKGSKRETDKQK